VQGAAESGQLFDRAGAQVGDQPLGARAGEFEDLMAL
jgi:hypothetical protein